VLVLVRSELCDNHSLPPYQFDMAKGIGIHHEIETNMTGILAIETATDACSIAVYRDGEYRERHVIAPRQHSQLLFTMLGDLLESGDLLEQGIELIAYGCGPGSFTGLRIAASAVQGLAYSCQLPVVAVSTLAVMAQCAMRMGATGADDTVLCTLDAHMNEIYSAVYGYEDRMAVLREGPWACTPAELAPVWEGSLCAVGSGCQFLDQFSQSLRAQIQSSVPDLLPAARDLIPLALEKFRRGEIESARNVQPVYVRDEISWKKLADQGRCK
jgi:tRNA threonylcarbamoyladenosine biosynthesis protein TsaB